MKRWICLSPHLDDAVFSCGGLIWEQAQRGAEIEIWTVFAGDPPTGSLSPYAERLHERWRLGREAAGLRREEDIRACALAGAVPRHFDLSDCIYRRDPVSLEHLYEGDEAIFGEPARVEIENLVPALAGTWSEMLPGEVQILAPLSLGGHVDHRLVRLAADILQGPVTYYADTPYVFAWEAMIPSLLPEQAHETVYPIRSEGLRAWMAANAAYASQISTFWESESEMATIFERYVNGIGGVRLWTKAG